MCHNIQTPCICTGPGLEYLVNVSCGKKTYPSITRWYISMHKNCLPFSVRTSTKQTSNNVCSNYKARFPLKKLYINTITHICGDHFLSSFFLDRTKEPSDC